ncbi:hypothetical protein ACI65C_012316 [Semiaphis heraclei]
MARPCGEKTQHAPSSVSGGLADVATLQPAIDFPGPANPTVVRGRHPTPSPALTESECEHHHPTSPATHLRPYCTPTNPSLLLPTRRARSLEIVPRRLCTGFMCDTRKCPFVRSRPRLCPARAETFV